MNRPSLLCLLAAPLMLLALPAHAALHVFACEPEWGALAQELGGKLVDVSVATNALQDPHQIQAKPSLIARARNADLVVCTGAELEIGWLPVLLQQSGNAKVQPGQPGNFAAADYVQEARGADAWSTARRATCMLPAIRTSRPTRATSASSPRRWRCACSRSMQRMRPTTRRRRRASRSAGSRRSRAGRRKRRR